MDAQWAAIETVILIGHARTAAVYSGPTNVPSPPTVVGSMTPRARAASAAGRMLARLPVARWALAVDECSETHRGREKGWGGGVQFSRCECLSRVPIDCAFSGGRSVVSARAVAGGGRSGQEGGGYTQVEGMVRGFEAEGGEEGASAGVSVGDGR